MNTTNKAERIAQESKGISDNSIYLYVINKIQELSSKQKVAQKLADVGCGTGTLLGNIQRKIENLQLFGIDIVDYDHEKTYKFLKQDFNQNFELDQAPFDFVLSTEVIEHLENPRHLVRQLSSITKEGGYIILTTPNPYSWLSLLSFWIKGYHSSFGPKNYPAHITPVTSYQLQNIVSEIDGLSIDTIHYLPNGRIPGTSKRWSDFGFFFKGKRFSDNYIVTIKKLG